MKVSIRTQQGEETLSEEDPIIVRSAPHLMLIHDAIGSVLLDGRPLKTESVGDCSIAHVNFTTSVGFHCIEDASRSRFWFGTEDEKLRLEGIETMLETIRELGLSFQGQMLFTDGSCFVDPHIVYAWLEKRAEVCLKVLKEIAFSPVRSKVKNDRISTAIVGKPNIEATVKLIKGNMKELLEEGGGRAKVFCLDGKYYCPRKMIVGKKEITYNNIANERALYLLQAIISLSQFVVESNCTQHARKRALSWRKCAVQIASMDFFTGLSRGSAQVTDLVQTHHEKSDMRYFEVYSAWLDLQGRLGWNKPKLKGRYSYIHKSDLIYQTFAVLAIANALDAIPSSEILGSVQPAFTSECFDLYYDCTPPSEVLKSWRDDSISPISYEPDLVIVEKASGKVLVCDMKYRSDANQSGESSIRDVLVYMAVYGLNSVVVFYPPKELSYCSVTVISGCGHRIYEVPLSPAIESLSALKTSMENVLERGLQLPSWTS